MRVDLHVNGASRAADLPPGTTLLAALRDDLGLTGTRYGCGHGACGACYVLADGTPTAACKLPVEDAVGRRSSRSRASRAATPCTPSSARSWKRTRSSAARARAA